MKNINFLVNHISTYGPEGWSPESTFLGGTEESVVEWAKRIQAKGYNVTVYHNGKHGVYDEVLYMDRSQYEGGDGITINIKAYEITPQEPTWYLTNELDAKRLDLSKFNGVILPSKWAYDELDIDHPKKRILPHGYDKKQIFPAQKIKNQCLYASSPDRGLGTLIELWPKVVERQPDAQLLVTYNGSLDAPNVTCLGEIPMEAMNELYRLSDYWVHPCNGGELFCMAGVKAQVAQAIPVYFPIMALKETVRHGVACSEANFVDELVFTMNSEGRQQRIREGLKGEWYPDWDDTTKMLLDIIGT